VVLFGGYYKDLCFTDKRVIQFEVMRDRWKFLLKAASPLPLVVESGGDIGQVLPFLKAEILRTEIASIGLAFHGRARRGYISVVRRTGEVVELARIDTDVDRKMFDGLVNLVRSFYPEIPKSVT